LPGLAVILGSPHLARLKRFNFRDAGLTMAGYERMVEAATTTLAGIEVATFSGNTIPDPQEREPAYDSASGFPIHETEGRLSMTGVVLEANFGPQKWLHWYSRFGENPNFEVPLDLAETPLDYDAVLC